MKELLRVLRGGSWDIVPYYLRASFRSWGDPDYRDVGYGFRLVVRIKGE